MSNAYTEFCFSVELPSTAAAYLSGSITAYNALFDGQSCSPEFHQIIPDLVEQHGLLDAVASVDTAGSHGTVHIVSGDRGNIDALIDLLQHFLAQFPGSSPIGFECAFTADKPRPGFIGGSAFIVFADKVQSMSTRDWLHTFLSGAPLVDVHLSRGLVSGVQVHTELLHDYTVRVLDFDTEGDADPDTLTSRSGTRCEAFVHELATTPAEYPVGPNDPLTLMSEELNHFCDSHGFPRVSADELHFHTDDLLSEHHDWLAAFIQRWDLISDNDAVAALIDYFGGYWGEHPVYLRSIWQGQQRTEVSYWEWVARCTDISDRSDLRDPRYSPMDDSIVVQFLREHGFSPDFSEPGCTAFRKPVPACNEYISIVYDRDDGDCSDLAENSYFLSRYALGHSGWRQTDAPLNPGQAVAHASTLMLFPSLDEEEQVDYPNIDSMYNALSQIPDGRRVQSIQYEFSHPYFCTTPKIIEWAGDATSLASHLIDLWLPSATPEERSVALDVTKVHRT